jgi:nucleoside-diphosphate-sugar epimerase
MRVFLTGASGFIGTALIPELVSAGHQVLGLARSDAAAKSVIEAGAQVHRGHLEDLESLRSGAAASDAVIHCAFIHDFSQYIENAAIDRRAIEAMGAVLAGSGRPFITTSGTAGRTEEDAGNPNVPAAPRLEAEQLTLAMASRGVRASVLRLPPSVHDPDKQGLITMMIEIARQKGVSAYVGEGLNRWPAVHRLDAVHLYRLVLEKGAAGARYHAVAEEGVALKDIANAIGRGLKVPVVSQTPEEAAGHFGWLAFFMGVDVPASSTLTQERIGWHPTQIGLIRDLEHATAFGA